MQVNLNSYDYITGTYHCLIVDINCSLYSGPSFERPASGVAIDEGNRGLGAHFFGRGWAHPPFWQGGGPGPPTIL